MCVVCAQFPVCRLCVRVVCCMCVVDTNTPSLLVLVLLPCGRSPVIHVIFNQYILVCFSVKVGLDRSESRAKLL